MSAAVARRRKQLALRKKQAEAEALEDGGNNSNNAVLKQLEKLLESSDLGEEAVAYEALQLAQSQVRKRYHNHDFDGSCDLAYDASLALLKKGRLSVASQLLMLLTQSLREGHVVETEAWIGKMEELHKTHQTSIDEQFPLKKATGGDDEAEAQMVELKRLQKLQRDWLRQCVRWSSELGTIRYGHTKLQELLGHHCWKVATQLETIHEGEEPAAASQDVMNNMMIDDDFNSGDITVVIMDLKCDAIVHMALAEQPHAIVEWLATLPDPTKEQISSGHTCLPCERDALLTRTVLCQIAIENIRDANIVTREYIAKIEKRDLATLQTSYVSKDDGISPSHTMFACMLLRTVEKDTRTGPLFSWLLRSFKRELDMLHKPKIINGYTTKIGKMFFNIEPPPDMMKMMENMMGMMGGMGGGAGGGGGMPGGLNPQMMQALAAQMGAGGMM